MLQQSDSEVIVVDYGCNEGTADWVKSNYPNVKIVEFGDDPVFSLAIARNLGLKQASGKWVLFVDADVFIMQDIGFWIKKNAKEKKYYRIKGKGDLSGTFICAKKTLDMVEGYDEAFRGWGGEDVDLYTRLELSNLKYTKIPSKFLISIEHDDGLRGLVSENMINPKVKARYIYRSYLKWKYDYLIKEAGFPSLEERKKTMEIIKRDAEEKSQIELEKYPKRKRKAQLLFLIMTKKYLPYIYSFVKN
jgi:glycosyltransferase involved in cell wall biosynthesis